MGTSDPLKLLLSEAAKKLRALMLLLPWNAKSFRGTDVPQDSLLVRLAPNNFPPVAKRTKFQFLAHAEELSFDCQGKMTKPSITDQRRCMHLARRRGVDTQYR